MWPNDPKIKWPNTGDKNINGHSKHIKYISIVILYIYLYCYFIHLFILSFGALRESCNHHTIETYLYCYLVPSENHVTTTQFNLSILSFGALRESCYHHLV